MQDKLVGQICGKYQIIRRIAQGGMATVYLGKDLDLDRLVAIKILLPALAQNQVFLVRFRREALAAAKLKHENIINIYDFGECDGHYFMAMEYIEGGTLAERLADLRAQGRHMELQEGLRIVQQIAEALDCAHQQGIIHRDVKPSNILITEDGRPVLTDLGIAKAVAGTKLTRTMMAMGTPEYMSPEQGKGLKIDNRVDIYSLGVVFYEMLAGHPPFQADTPWSLVHQHIYEEAPELATVVPRKVRQIVAKAMSKEREHRYPSAEAMARDIEALLSGDESLEVAEPKPAGALSRLLGNRLALALGAGATVLVLLFLLFRSCMPPGLSEPTKVAILGTATPERTATRNATRAATMTVSNASGVWQQPVATNTPTREATVTPGSSQPVATPEINFTADEFYLEPGNCTVLRWRVEDADAVHLDGESVAPVGSRGVCPEQSVTYRLQAVADDWEGTAEVTIEVLEPGLSPTINPTVTVGPSPTVKPAGTVSPSLTVRPSVTVRPTPSVSFSADRGTLERGECTRLRWQVENASAVYLDGAGVVGVGSQQVCPESTITYRLRVVAAGWERTEDITITVIESPATPTVRPTPSAEFYADRQSLVRGECTTLRWQVENADAVYLDGAGVVGVGSRQVCPESTTTYRLLVVAGGWERTREVTISVTAPAPTPSVEFTADRYSLLAGACTDLRWHVENATAVYLDGAGVALVGSLQVCPESTTTYRLRAMADGWDNTREVTIDVTAPPPTPSVSFTADSYTVERGQCTVLRWQAQNAEGVYLDSVAVAVVGSEQVCPQNTTTYRLRVVAGGWEDTSEVTISVTEPPPTEPPPTLEWIQAESGRLEHPMVIEEDNEAWGGKYVRGIGNNNMGSVILSIPVVPTAGDYYVECRIQGPDWNQDSMYVRMDEGFEMDWRWTGGPDAGWHKELVRAKGASGPYVFHLSPGTHQLRFRTREPGARLDAVRLVPVN